MSDPLLSKEIIGFLKTTEFINIATCDSDLCPNVAPKFLLKVEDDCIYLGDYNIDRTWVNINFNPKVSLSVINPHTLIGYQINGTVEPVDDDPLQKKLLREFDKKKTHFSTKRVIEGVKKESCHDSFEAGFPDRVIIYKVRVEEVIEIKPGGQLERKKL